MYTTTYTVHKEPLWRKILSCVAPLKNKWNSLLVGSGIGIISWIFAFRIRISKEDNLFEPDPTLNNTYI
jgi:hypothetical protein